jgi:hypothetical protein
LPSGALRIRRSLRFGFEMPYWFDGNNLIGKPAAGVRTDRETRRSFLSFLSERRHTHGGRLTVYFDGDDPDRSMPPAGIRIRYSAPISADDAIIRDISASRTPGEIIVVTNDVGLGARCRDSGAQAIKWVDFSGRSKSPSPRARGKDRTEEPVDVEEWARYFGLDDTNLS